MLGQEVFAWAHGRGLSGKEPSAITVGARMAALSRSFYKFLIRMGIVKSNPCDALERTGDPPAARRDPRYQEWLARPGDRAHAGAHRPAPDGRDQHTRGDLSEENGAVYYRYRGKGGKQAERELPRPSLLASWSKRPRT